MNDPAEHTETRMGYTLRIIVDENPPHPRVDFSCCSTWVCFVPGVDLGDHHGYDREDFDDWDDLDDLIRRDNPGCFTFPIHYHEQSGQVVSVGDLRTFGAQVGVGFVTEDGLQEWGGDRDAAMRAVEGEVEDYNEYLRGDAWGYIITDFEGNEVDSLWGMYGLDYATEVGRRALKVETEDVQPMTKLLIPTASWKSLCAALEMASDHSKKEPSVFLCHLIDVFHSALSLLSTVKVVEELN